MVSVDDLRGGLAVSYPLRHFVGKWSRQFGTFTSECQTRIEHD